MTYDVHFTPIADKNIKLFKKSNPAAYKKTMQLLVELWEHPRTGTGHPEPLTRGNSVTYSRTITKRNRLVYDVYDDEKRVEVLRVEGHYEDK
jgi:toxin YoeB